MPESGRTPLLAAVDVGGTYIKYGVVEYDQATARAAVLWHSSIPTHASDGVDAVLERIVGLVEEIGCRNAEIQSIGLGVPGIIVPGTGIVRNPPNLPGWTNVDLSAYLREHSQNAATLPVYVENDANCGALAELWAGAGKGRRNFVYVTLGTGIGGGLVLDGRLYTGDHGEAGEIGHMMQHALCEDRNKRTAADRFGSPKLEDVVGIQGIIDRYGEEVTVREIDERAALGDARARKVLDDTGEILGWALCDVLAVLGVRTIIVGGGVSRSTIVLDAITRTLRQSPLPTQAANVQLLQAHFVDHAGLVGAALLGVA